MKAALIWSGLASLAAAATAPSINGLGSSYSAGPGLAKPIGKILTEKLNARPGSTQYTFNNIAVSGSVLKDVHDKQAPQLATKNPAVVYLVSGGNDLNYVHCLKSPNDDVCKHPISKDEFIKRYGAALTAITSNTGHDTKLPIYAVTYLTAIGKDTKCGNGHKDCTLNDDQKSEVTGIYTDVVDWTVDAIESWKATGNNKDYKLTQISMRENSIGHDVGSTTAAWINGATVPKGAGGVAWHPNNAGAEAVAEFIYKDLTGSN